MSLLNRILSAGSPAAPLYSDDVFSAYTYSGTGAAQTITNGINLTGKGGMVWLKERNAAISHMLCDTVRGAGYTLASNLTNAEIFNLSNFDSFTSTGFVAGVNKSTVSTNYISWTFRKAPKFFDVVTYTGTGANRTISHSLGSVPGMIIVKRTDAVSDWQVYHTSLANTEYMVLNSTAAKATGATRWNSTTPTASVFSLGTDTTVNASGGTYVAYLFAHDSSADGIVQCGSFAGTSTVNLGWEPQFLLVKRIYAPIDDWRIIDTSRSWSMSALSALYPNTSGAEWVSGAEPNFYPTATGFYYNTSFNGSVTHIYLAIRRPNKPPTLGTQVYNAIARTGTGAAATVTGVGFAPDLLINDSRSGTTGAWFEDRLRGATKDLTSATTAAETTVAQAVTAFNMDGASIGTNTNWNTNAATYINWFFKRAPGVFDEVCYTGTGSATTVAHSLGVVPELMIVKKRSATDPWMVYCAQLASPQNKYLILNNTGSESSFALWNAVPTASVFSIGSDTTVNGSGATYVAYLFATKAGISKVFSYTGNGSSQTINCGFTTGARFVLIKRTDASGDWYVWDSTRGIIAANDPHLSLNTTAAEVTTDDSVDTDTTGFIVNQVAATNVNVTSATYIGMAFA